MPELRLRQTEISKLNHMSGSQGVLSLGVSSQEEQRVSAKPDPREQGKPAMGGPEARAGPRRRNECCKKWKTRDIQGQVCFPESSSLSTPTHELEHPGGQRRPSRRSGPCLQRVCSLVEETDMNYNHD